MKVSSSPQTRSTLRRCLLSAVVATIALTGCAASFNSETSAIYDPAAGSNHRSGGIYLIDAAVITDPSGNGVLSGTLTNETSSNDALTGVSIESTTGQTGTVTIQGGSVELPAGGAVQLLTNSSVAVNAPALKAGYSTTLKFTFRRAGSFTLDVPVLANTGDFESVTIPTPSTSTPTS